MRLVACARRVFFDDERGTAARRDRVDEMLRRRCAWNVRYCLHFWNTHAKLVWTHRGSPPVRLYRGGGGGAEGKGGCWNTNK